MVIVLTSASSMTRPTTGVTKRRRPWFNSAGSGSKHMLRPQIQCLSSFTRLNYCLMPFYRGTWSKNSTFSVFTTTYWLRISPNSRLMYLRLHLSTQRATSATVLAMTIRKLNLSSICRSVWWTAPRRCFQICATSPRSGRDTTQSGSRNVILAKTPRLRYTKRRCSISIKTKSSSALPIHSPPSAAIQSW